MKNKKRLIILVLMIVIIFILIGTSLYIVNNKQNNNIPNTEFIIVKSYSNFAWHPVFYGEAIFSNGEIYSWEFKGSSFSEYENFIGNNDISTEEGLKSFIKLNGKKETNKLSTKTLESLQNIINDLTVDETKYQHNCHGADMGQNIISLFKNNEEYKLKEYGDCDGQSNSTNVKKLLDIIQNR